MATMSTATSNTTGQVNDGSPPTKRRKPCDGDGINGTNHGDDGEIDALQEDIQRAWDHYRNFIDGDDDGEGEEEKGGDEDQEREVSCTGDSDNFSQDHVGIAQDHPSGGADGEEGGGDVDELLELIEILYSAKVASSPLELSTGPSSSVRNNSWYLANNIASNQTPPLHKIESLVPILLSMSHLHLASHAISETMFDPNDTQAPENDQEEVVEIGNSSLSSPDNHFQQSLHHWPTNPAAHSLLANYHRMNSLSSSEKICGHYIQAAEYARIWRGLALKFLQSEGEEGREGIVNAKEWVELLLLNGALDVDYIGNYDEEEGDGDNICGNDNDKANQGKGEEEEEYSCSQVEATASFMSAFLLSTMLRHEEALLYLRKFRLSHRIHPNIWKEAQSSQSNRDKGNNDGIDGSKGEPCSGKSTLLFPPRIYHGSAHTASGASCSENGTDNHGCSSQQSYEGGVLPKHLYRRLCALLAPKAQYWKESDYDHRGYYSYFINFDAAVDSSPSTRGRPSNVIEEVIIDHLLPLAERTLRESTESSSKQTPRIVGAEWWAHTRPLGANLGHQVHYDTDESLLGREGKVTHPVISSVLYLTGSTAGVDVDKEEGDDSGPKSPGSTVVFDQTPNSKDIAPRAWVSRPRNNSFMVFPGDLLHGVLPCVDGRTRQSDGVGSGYGIGGDDDDKDESIHRLTFMVGFWTRDVTDGMGERQLYTPCGPLPPSDSNHSWVMDCHRGYGGDCTKSRKGKNGGYEIMQGRRLSDFAYDVLPSASPAWEKFNDANDAKQSQTGGPTLTIPKGLDHRFFVWNAPHCFASSLYEKEDCF